MSGGGPPLAFRRDVPARSWVQAIAKRGRLVMENDLLAQAEYEMGVESVTRSEDDLQLVSGLASVSCALETTVIRDEFQVVGVGHGRLGAPAPVAHSLGPQAYARREHNEENVLFWVHSRVYELTHPLASGRPSRAGGGSGGGALSGTDARSATDRASSAVGRGTSFSSTATELDNDVDASVANTLASSVSGLWKSDGVGAAGGPAKAHAGGIAALVDRRPSNWGLAPRARVEVVDSDSEDGVVWPSDEAHATTIAHARTIFERFLRQGSAQWVRCLCYAEFGAGVMELFHRYPAPLLFGTRSNRKSHLPRCRCSERRGCGWRMSFDKGSSAGARRRGGGNTGVVADVVCCA